MSMDTGFENFRRKNITATDTAVTNRGKLVGIFCATSSGATIAVADAAGVIVGTFDPGSAAFYPMPCKIRGDLAVTINGTVNATVFWEL